MNDSWSFFRERWMHPEVTFSPKPMWFLNGALEEGEMTRQLEDFSAHGVRGVILHPRIGLPKSLDYLDDRFMELIRHAVSECDRLGMEVLLYDEGMYPSGSANGQVVRENPEFASRGLRLVKGSWQPAEGETSVAHLALMLKDGACTHSRKLAEGAQPAAGETEAWLVSAFTHGTIRGIHADEDDGGPNAPRSADILNPEAVRCFIRRTHDRYAEWVGEWFGNTITGFFCDEPDPMGRNAPKGWIPWTPGMEALLSEAGLTVEELPALWLDMGSETASIRDRWERLLQKRLGESFYAQLQDWCNFHHLSLTGHPAHAGDLAMEKYFDIPGQDVVWRWVAPENGLSLYGAESTQGICASSAMLHAGKRRNSSECFGCCGPQGKQWQFTASDMLFYLNWLFVRGCNCIYPHAFLYSVKEPVQRNDRPPDVGPNNYWWPWENRIADYISRCCAMLTDVQACPRVTILTDGAHLPWNLAAELFQKQIEFTYLETERAEAAAINDGRLCIADQAYDIVAAEDPQVLSDTLSKKLLSCGIHVLKTWEASPKEAAEEIDRLLAGHTHAEGAYSDQIRILSRRKGNLLLLFVSNEGETAWQGRIVPETSGYCEKFDPWTGEQTPQGMSKDRIPLSLEYRESVFLIIDPDKPALNAVPQKATTVKLTALIQWTAEFPDGTTCQVPLGDWQQWPGMGLFFGTMAYHASVIIPEKHGRVKLELGQVKEMATVEVNGKECAVLLKPPFRCELTDCLQPGVNEITVRVTGNFQSGYENTPSPAGLFGPVKLLTECGPTKEN